MKKSILLLSMVLTLAACSSDDTRKDENSLPPGIMQPEKAPALSQAVVGCRKFNNNVCQSICNKEYFYEKVFFTFTYYGGYSYSL